MSFSSTVKEELCALPMKRQCCRRALLLGAMAARADLVGDRLRLRVGGDALHTLLSHLVTEQFGRDPVLRQRQDAVAARALSFSSPAAASALTDLLSAPDGAQVPEKCPGCRPAFLRGVFLAAGRLSDPEKGYLLELSCGDRRDFIHRVLLSCGFSPKSADRRRERLLYFRDSTAIEDILTYMGATQATFSIMDSKIAREMRNDANRQANCDANNIGKTISAAQRQVDIIRRLRDENKLSFLPQELVNTALARLEHSDLSLGQLAAVVSPPMTKSGLNHRLAKIMEYAEGLLD